MVKYQKIVLATSNQGKVKELTALLQPLNIELIPPSAFNIPDADETGLTFIENAIIKARHASQLSGLPALADDSGLAVAALHGAPGIHSARYAGDHATPQVHIEKLLTAMREVPTEKRQAEFHCVLALMTSPDDPTPIICHGRWQGMVLSTPSGQQGFGYDPIFYVNTEQKSAAELTSSTKNKISHRGQALRQLLSLLAEKS